MTARRRRGFALLAAMWLLIAISALSVELSMAARERRIGIANTLEAVRATAAAESGTQDMCARLAHQRLEGSTGAAWNDPITVLDPWHAIERPTRDSVILEDGAAYTVAASDLGTKVNINITDEAELRRFLTASGIDAMVADALSQAMMDWRDADESAVFAERSEANTNERTRESCPATARSNRPKSCDSYGG